MKQLAVQRTSTRWFKDQAVPHEKIDEALKVSMPSPSTHKTSRTSIGCTTTKSWSPRFRHWRSAHRDTATTFPVLQ